jgi:DNA-binding NarL/FixJ family response regulator
VGYQPPPTERALGEPYLDAARSRLSEAEWEVAFAEGRNMGLEEAVEYALSEEETTTPVPERPPANASSALTRREKEIAALVARDLTNRQIAKELAVSERTVENHVANILKKLGLHSREWVAASITER